MEVMKLEEFQALKDLFREGTMSVDCRRGLMRSIKVYEDFREKELHKTIESIFKHGDFNMRVSGEGKGYKIELSTGKYDTKVTCTDLMMTGSIAKACDTHLGVILANINK